MPAINTATGRCCQRITQFYLQITPYLPLPCKHSPDGTSPDWGCSLLPVYLLERMRGWVGLVGCPIADGLPTQVVTRQLQLQRRTAKVCQSKTNVLRLCHTTIIVLVMFWTMVRVVTIRRLGLRQGQSVLHNCCLLSEGFHTQACTQMISYTAVFYYGTFSKAWTMRLWLRWPLSLFYPSPLWWTF